MFEVMSTGYYSITLQRLFKFRSVEADRSNSVASLEMENTTFPKDPILVSLLAATQRVADPEPMINDVMGFSKGYPDLLGDVLATRARLRQQLPEAALETNQLLKEEFPYIFLFCQSGYEWLVGFFAIRALGGAVMPLGTLVNATRRSSNAVTETVQRKAS
jgi:malonyl-CoA/methylmalonyl-CoA synthetase